jgi:hypothetical protein
MAQQKLNLLDNGLRKLSDVRDSEIVAKASLSPACYKIPSDSAVRCPSIHPPLFQDVPQQAHSVTPGGPSGSSPRPLWQSPASLSRPTLAVRPSASPMQTSYVPTASLTSCCAHTPLALLAGYHAEDLSGWREEPDLKITQAGEAAHNSR